VIHYTTVDTEISDYIFILIDIDDDLYLDLLLGHLVLERLNELINIGFNIGLGHKVVSVAPTVEAIVD
jgi:hypothetical protein